MAITDINVNGGYVWSNIGYIKGPKGDSGKDGSDGNRVLFGNGHPTISANINDTYVDFLTGDVYIYNYDWALEGTLHGIGDSDFNWEDIGF
jgi:hypothetical protein